MSILTIINAKAKMSFAEQIKASQGQLVYLVRGKDAGKEAWYYVLVDKHKLPLFKKALGNDSMDLAHYGKVLYSGWGENPPHETAQAIKERYS